MEYVVGLLFFLIAHPYVFYPASLVLLNCRQQHGQVQQAAEENCLPTISLLIAAYNEEKVIADKLVNAMKLDYPADKLEIVVGSDGSTDRTNEIVQAFASAQPQIKLLAYLHREGKVNVLNKAVQQCAGEIVVFSDANAFYNTSALKHMAGHFANPRIGCVAGEKKMKIAGDQDWIGENEGLYWKLESFIKRQESRLKTVIGADGAMYAIKKSLFTPLPRDTSVDDFLISMLIVLQGYRIAYEPRAFSYEAAGRSLAEELKRKVRIAAGNYYNLRYLPGPWGWNLLSYLFISHKLLRWASPFIFIVLTLCLFGQVYNPACAWLLVLILASYGIAVLGYCFEQKLLKYRVVSLITHFYLAVYAQFSGWLKYCKGTQKAIWETIR